MTLPWELWLILGWGLVASLLLWWWHKAHPQRDAGWNEPCELHPAAEHVWSTRQVFGQLDAGVSIFDAACACGWRSEYYSVEAGAQVEAERHATTGAP